LTPRQKKYLVIGPLIVLVCAFYYWCHQPWPPTPRDWVKDAFIFVFAYAMGEIRHRDRAEKAQERQRNATPREGT
jgi:hypothetical protein